MPRSAAPASFPTGFLITGSFTAPGVMCTCGVSSKFPAVGLTSLRRLESPGCADSPCLGALLTWPAASGFGAGWPLGCADAPALTDRLSAAPAINARTCLDMLSSSFVSPPGSSRRIPGHGGQEENPVALQQTGDLRFVARKAPVELGAPRVIPLPHRNPDVISKK